MITLLRWLPASGKSTWAKENADENTVILSKDDLRIELHWGKYSKKNEKEVIRVQEERTIEAILQKKDVIIDDTNLNPIHFKRFLDIALKYDVEITNKNFLASVDECIKRDKQREKSVWENVIRSMSKRWHWDPELNEFESIATFSEDKEEAVIFDIDWTLASMSNRSPYDMSRVEEDWYHVDMFRLADILKDKYKIILLSGRNESARSGTIKWLWFYQDIFSELHMRTDGDNRKDSIVKYEMLKDLNETYNIRYIFDDRDQVVSMHRQAGFRCLQVAKGNF